MGNNFMQKGLKTGTQKSGYSSVIPRFTNRLYLPVGAKDRIILLDDAQDAAVVYEHGIYIQGDKGSMKLRVTCLSAGEDAVPTKCRLCNAMIQDDRIYRQATSFLSCIALSSFTIEGETYTHMKKLVPLNVKAAKRLLARREDIGSLKGAMFAIYRSDQTEPRVGGDWQFLKRINLLKFFKNSPRLDQLIASAKKRGVELSKAQALKQMITPFDYAEELAPTAKKINYFLGYIGMDDQIKGSSAEDSTSKEYEEAYGDDEPDVPEEDFSEFEDDEEEAPPAPPKKKGKKKVKKTKKKA